MLQFLVRLTHSAISLCAERWNCREKCEWTNCKTAHYCSAIWDECVCSGSIQSALTHYPSNGKIWFGKMDLIWLGQQGMSVRRRKKIDQSIDQKWDASFSELSPAVRPKIHTLNIMLHTQANKRTRIELVTVRRTNKLRHLCDEWNIRPFLCSFPENETEGRKRALFCVCLCSHPVHTVFKK